jgi:uroporphyrinogen decarboxylase
MTPPFIGTLPTPRPQREPDFGQMLRVLRRQRPEHPVLFEFCLNERLYCRAIGEHSDARWGPYDFWRRAIPTHCHFGYDCLTVPASSFGFPRPTAARSATLSLNDQPAFTDRAGFAAYAWPDPAAAEPFLDRFAAELPRGMSLIPRCGSVLESAISLLGFDNLCMMLSDNPALAADVFDAVGSRLVRHCQLHAAHPAAGACCPSDDWGFKTQTMLSPQDMRKYVFPWHKRMVQAIHAAGKPAILHCCGQVAAVMDDIIDDMKYDAKHSFEDAILPVEQAYERWGKRIAILGGIDLDFLCRSEPATISQRARAMLALSRQRGGYALGSGNSIPPYVPDEHFLAMIGPALDEGAS